MSLLFLGYSLTKQKSFTTSLLVGYIGYSFVLAVGFIIIQLLGLPWRIALIYFIVSILVMIIFIMYRLKKNDFKITKNEVLNGFKSNYALFFDYIYTTYIVICECTCYVVE